MKNEEENETNAMSLMSETRRGTAALDSKREAFSATSCRVVPLARKYFSWICLGLGGSSACGLLL